MLKKLNRTTAQAPQRFPVKILQFGKGNFLRAFADWMVDIANEKTGFNGAVEIIQTNSRDNDIRFHEQQGLFHVVTRGLRQGTVVNEVRLITCVTGVINPYEDYAAYLRTGENPDLEFIISNTTEAGIEFNADDRDPQRPASSFPGKLAALLYHRFKSLGSGIHKPLIVLPCELIERNGEILGDIVLQYARHWNLPPEFTSFIENEVRFCNTLVDRIVPGFPRDTAAELWDETGFEDPLLVASEPYHLWFIQAPQIAGLNGHDLQVRLPLEDAGLNVKIVSDLAPYRTRKVRILNGAHTAMVPVAYLRGLRTVREAVEDPFTGNFVREAIEEEIIPTLDLPVKELREFSSDVIERFRNPFIQHELSSIALNCISKFQVRVLPSILEYFERRRQLPARLLYSLAALILFYRGTWKGDATPIKDRPEVLAFFKDVWTDADFSRVAKLVLSNTDLWKTDLNAIDGLAGEVTKYMEEIANG